MPKLFISYRREDSNDISGRIYDRLIKEFGESNVFKDVYSIPLGSDFRQILSEAVVRCDVVLSIIGKRWVDVTDRAGKKRLESESDFVRVELEAALRRGIPVIPVLVDGASVPAPENLPTTLRDLSFRNGAPVRYDPDFHNDMDRLVVGLKRFKRARVPTGAKQGDNPRALSRTLGVATVSLIVLISGLFGASYWWPSKSVAPDHRNAVKVAGSIPAPDNPAPAPPANVDSPVPPQPSASAVTGAGPAENAEITELFARMRRPGSKDSINVGLWIAAPITPRDLPIFEALAEAMRSGNARLGAVSLPEGFAVEGLDDRIPQDNDPRKLLERKDVDAVIIYGIYRDDAVVPAFMKDNAPTPSRRTHLALVWCSQAGQDSFLIVPTDDPSGWKPSRLDPGQIEGGEDAVSASLKYDRIVAVGNKLRGNDFGEFFKSVRTRGKSPSQISNLVK